MSCSESELDFNFDINSKSESESSSEFMNLEFVFFLLYTCTLLNKLAGNFFLFILITESIVMQPMQV